MNGIVLSAGLGTRFRPHTLTLPKPALPFLDIPLIYYSLYIANLFEPEQVFVNTHYLPEKIDSLISDKSHPFSFSISSSFEKEILGSSGGIGKLRTDLSQRKDFFALNADMILIPEKLSLFQEALQFHLLHNPISTLLVTEHPEAGKKYGAVWVDSESNVIAFGKTPPKNKKTRPLHFVGLQIINSEIFNFIPKKGASEMFIDVLPKAFSEGFKTKAFNANLEFFDAGQLNEFLANTRRGIQLIKKENELMSSVQKFFDRKFQIKDDCYISDSCEIHPDSEISKSCVIGSHVQINKNCVVTNSCVASEVQISPENKIENELVLESR